MPGNRGGRYALVYARCVFVCGAHGFIISPVHGPDVALWIYLSAVHGLIYPLLWFELLKSVLFIYLLLYALTSVNAIHLCTFFDNLR